MQTYVGRKTIKKEKKEGNQIKEENQIKKGNQIKEKIK